MLFFLTLFLLFLHSDDLVAGPDTSKFCFWESSDGTIDALIDDDDDSVVDGGVADDAVNNDTLIDDAGNNGAELDSTVINDTVISGTANSTVNSTV